MLDCDGDQSRAGPLETGWPSPSPLLVSLGTNISSAMLAFICETSETMAISDTADEVWMKAIEQVSTGVQPH